MSIPEHLIENAIVCLEKKKTIDDFKNREVNKLMLNEVHATAEEIWDMAIYVVYTYKESIVWETEEKIEKKYGYPIPE